VDAVGHVDVGVAGVDEGVHLAKDFCHAVRSALQLAKVTAHVLHVSARTEAVSPRMRDARGRRWQGQG
jgi:hypothetical protein